MVALAEDPLVRFVGYGVRYGGKAAGTLRGVSETQLVETPVAENLMVGLAIGMSLAGLRPVVFIERFDFILNAMDAIVNHLDKIGVLSKGLFQPAAIIRVVAGNRNTGLQTGLTHTQDFSGAMRHMLSPAFDVISLVSPTGPGGVFMAYNEALARLRGQNKSTMLIEYKDMY